MHRQGGLPIPDIEHIMQPHWFANGFEQDPEQFGLAAARALEEKILELGADNVAAFIAEPIQGAGGVIVPPDSYWPEVQRIVKQYDVLLIADEVICGFGRTGKWFGSQYYDLQPDLMPVAKGLSSGYLPIGGVIVSDRVAAGLESGGEFNHGYTYSGHPACAAAAVANLDLMQRSNIVKKVENHIGPYFQAQLDKLNTHTFVGQTRGAGMLGAIQLVPEKPANTAFPKEGDIGVAVRDYCLEAGLVMRAVGDSMILSPPLVINEAEIDELFAIARAGIDHVYKEWCARA